VSAAIIIALVLGLHAWNISEYALTPGNATPVAPLVKIHGVATNPRHDTIMLADVYLQSLSAWQWLTMHFQSHVQFVPAAALVDPGIPNDELGAQGFLEMRDAKQAAEVTAFRTLGWTVPATRTGSIVNGVVSPSPARSAGVHVGDEIVAVNATPVRSTCELIGDVHDLAPGTSVRLQIERVKISDAGTLSWGPVQDLSVKTAAVPSSVGVSGCTGLTGRPRSWLGVSGEDGFSYRLPATVSIDTANIGGPSAGLAMTLSLINELSSGSLTGHHVVAATGTIDVKGDVGDVGGVAEKTVAVQRAGASYFIVPEVEVATARAAASPGLKILGVTTLSQALRDLRRLGGVAPQPLTTPLVTPDTGALRRSL
jgi:PDZ domain-containing protein